MLAARLTARLVAWLGLAAGLGEERAEDRRRWGDCPDAAAVPAAWLGLAMAVRVRAERLQWLRGLHKLPTRRRAAAGRGG